MSDLSFRDRISTVDEKGKRRWIYPKLPSGRFTNLRAITAVFLLFVFLVVPWIKIGGQPLFLFDVLNRKFIILGILFWPQDFIIVAFGLIFIFVAIILFTSIFGRFWCGWTCPQTVFMEFVYRRIENLIEGDYIAQQKLNNSPWTPAKIFKKLLKHGIFFGIAFLVGNGLLAWIIGVDALKIIVTDPPSLHITGLMAMLFFSGLFYFIFSWFREQACVLVCPYARFQSVLLDRNSISVMYDFIRGEPRGKKSEGGGDCIDCHQCVTVCPTGIDIRNGNQLECVNCTACMDACDSVMTKMKKPLGLIRYASQDMVENQKKFRITTRIKLYSVLFTLLFSMVVYLVITRPPVEGHVTRVRGNLYTELPDGRIINVYELQGINKTFQEYEISLKLLQPQKGEASIPAKTMKIAGADLSKTTFIVNLPPDVIKNDKMEIILGIESQGKLLGTVKTNFLAPKRFSLGYANK